MCVSLCLGAEHPWHVSRGPVALVGPSPWEACIKVRFQPSFSSFSSVIFLGPLLPFSSLKMLRKHRFSSFFCIDLRQIVRF